METTFTNSTIDEADRSNWDCNICSNPSSQSVVSFCGHVFCWPCIYRSMEEQMPAGGAMGGRESKCPVCEKEISRDKLVPIYGQNFNNEDPRNVIPPRPLAQYSEQPSFNQFHQSPSNSNDISNFVASASFNFGAFGFRASLGPSQTTIRSWGISNGEGEDTSNSIGQIFVAELTKNLFFSVSLLSFLYMLII